MTAPGWQRREIELAPKSEKNMKIGRHYERQIVQSGG